jgi:hypothetical protein
MSYGHLLLNLHFIATGTVEQLKEFSISNMQLKKGAYSCMKNVFLDNF